MFDAGHYHQIEEYHIQRVHVCVRACVCAYAKKLIIYLQFSVHIFLNTNDLFAV